MVDRRPVQGDDPKAAPCWLDSNYITALKWMMIEDERMDVNRYSMSRYC